MNTTRLIIGMASVALLMTGCSRKKQEVENVVTVKTQTVHFTTTSGELNYTGIIEEESGVSLSFAGAGTIKRLQVCEGQNVVAGQLIGVIDAATAANATAVAQAATRQAREALAQAQDAYTRMRMLHDNGSLPEIKWVETETKVAQAKQMLHQTLASEQIARKGLADTRLTAPFSGYIAHKSADIGQNVLPGQPVVSLVKIDRVKVKISVPEEEIAQIRIGQQIRFHVSSLSNEPFWGQVSEKSVSADPISRSYTVKAIVDNPNHRLLPGMVCDVYTSIGQQANGISLPANIVQIDIDNDPFIWTVVNGKARKVHVVLGENIGENVMIRSGIQQGDQVIVSGQQKICDGQKIVIIK